MDSTRVISQLRELDERSGGKRVAWSDVWSAERERVCREFADGVPAATIDRDQAGNIWFELAGELPGTVVIGSHLDCVPDGGWLDGCLGVLAALEIARGIAVQAPAGCRTLRVVDWADEEGALTGHSLLGSSAAAGTLDLDLVATLVTTDGIGFVDLLRTNGVQPAQMDAARGRLEGVDAYLELHIEQGPVLEAAGRACSAVSGCLGVRRAQVTFGGIAAHAGATPMSMRHDPALAAAGFLLGAREAAIAADGLATVGTLQARPGTPTAVAATVQLMVDVRHRDLSALDALDTRLASMAARVADDAGCSVTYEPTFSLDPIAFDTGLVTRAAALTGGEPLISGPLHDAAAVAGAGVPAAMMFVRTRGGISHSRAEDASEADIATACEAFSALVEQVVHDRA